jgi:hydrogenase expression/formation protein HypC
MCLAVPGKIIEITGEDPWWRSARVSFAGAIKNVSLACVPEARVGDFVLVHVGVAIGVVDPAEAEETWRYLSEMDELAGLESDAPGDEGKLR